MEEKKNIREQLDDEELSAVNGGTGIMNIAIAKSAKVEAAASRAVPAHASIPVSPVSITPERKEWKGK